MGAGIVSAIIDSVVKAAFAYLSSVMEKRGLIQQGQAAQAAAETANAEKSEARMNDAQANAPRTPDEALQRLKDGTS